ncbi:hypothetical protein Tco_1384214 [Tanacetum coccineum]
MKDVVEHIAKVLKLVDLIYVPGVDSHQLRMKVFPLSLADDAKEWWISEGDGKITTWEQLVEKFFCRFYPESYDGEDEILDEGENWGIDLLEFLSNSKRYVDNNTSSNNEWKESKNENPSNTAIIHSSKPMIFAILKKKMNKDKQSVKTTIMMISNLTKEGPREANIDEYWWRIYKSGNLEVLES